MKKRILNFELDNRSDFRRFWDNSGPIIDFLGFLAAFTAGAVGMTLLIARFREPMLGFFSKIFGEDFKDSWAAKVLFEPLMIVASGALAGTAALAALESPTIARGCYSYVEKCCKPKNEEYIPLPVK